MEKDKVAWVDEPHREILDKPSIQNPFTYEEVFIHLEHFTKEFQDGVLRYNYGKPKES